MTTDNTSSGWDSTTQASVEAEIFSAQAPNTEQLEILRSKIREFPEDPQLWEQFALELAHRPDVSKDDVINAYRQAEALYLDLDDKINAGIIAKKLGGISIS
jgi:hypothetical protein